MFWPWVSVPVRIPGWPGDVNVVCTSDEAVHWKTLPQKLLIVGGGVIGCEFACLMNAMGVQVTIVELLPRLLPTLDAELGAGLEKIFKARGITLHLQTKVDDLQLIQGGTTAQAKLSNNSSLDVDRVLVCVGRANTKNLGLEALGVNLSKKGFVPVDDSMQTNKSGLYCIGDANGRCLLAHAASAHGIAAVENALGHGHAFTAPIPSAVYTFPEVGSVGLTQEECVAQGLPVSIGKFPLGYLGKAMAAQHTDGFVKVIRHRETDAILGVHILGHNATEYIAAAGTMVHQKATVHDLAEVVFAHPTLSEAIKESAEDALGMALHLPPRKIHKLEALMT
ncbi:MAG: FAD-dependent oxidoreductase [Phycisphaerales bacterium]|nr:FAD-dependent oxidoreductase [Phycisphaerales bacterium]